MNSEIWKDVKGYEGHYQVSNMGNVRSLDIKVKCRNNKTRIIKGKDLKPILTKNGYLFINLWDKNNCKRGLVHILVAKAFIPNPKNKLEVNHKDTNKKNNCVNNLEWNTRSENTLHSYKMKLRENQRKKVSETNKILKSKIVTQYDLKNNFIQKFPSTVEAAKYYKCYSSAISRCCRGECKTAYGYIWKYL